MYVLLMKETCCFVHHTPKVKPPPVYQEFTDLAEILMEENQWDIPQDCQEALTLYFNLINSIHE